VSTGYNAIMFDIWHNFSISSGFTEGINTLEFFVQNNDGGSGDPNPSGLRVELSLTASELTAQASNPTPADIAIGVGVDTDLSWAPGIEATSHDVYFGTDFNDVNEAVYSAGEIDGNSPVNFFDLQVIAEQWLTNPDSCDPSADVDSDGNVNLVDYAIFSKDWFKSENAVFKGNQPVANTTYDLPTLSLGTTYYWRIDSVGSGGGVVKGEVWSFTTTSMETYNVMDYGATGNGSTHDHGAVNSAINAANSAGGGIVYFPAGTYKCGSIILKSNVTLDLHADAEIQATMDYEYSMWDSFSCSGYDDDWGHSHWKCSLIWAVDQENIGITGSGFIDGTDPATNYTGLDKGDPSPGFADRALSFKNCTGITIDGVRILRGGHFAIIATGCTDVDLSNLFIDTNRDGINIDCCNDVTITNCIVNAPCDDAIGLKSSYGLCERRPTENVIISGCYVSGYEVGSVMSGSPVPNTNPSCYSCGSIKFGTESYGGFKNITITDCTFENSRGFMLATVDGGDIENIYIDNIQMSLINDPPIFLRLGDRGRNPGPLPPGIYRNVHISNVTCGSTTSKLSCIASGVPGHYIEDVNLSNLHINYKGGGTAADAAVVLPENEAGYPYGGMFGPVTPSYAFYFRHVKNVEIHDSDFSFTNNDVRPPFVTIDVDGFLLDNVTTE
jgi:polygalacturonase